MPELEQKAFQRQTAYKVRISDLLNQNYMKGELSAGYIKLNGVNISRVNVIATVVYKPESSSFSTAVIDDGTGRIPLRSFENNGIFSKIEVSDAVLVVGKIREFNGEKYILPEILKKINNFGWLNVRKLELASENAVENIKAIGNVAIEDSDNKELNEEIYSLIKKLDSGDGATIDDVIKNSNNSEAENVVNKLLNRGDIFEIRPGKLKVLE